MDSNEEMNYAIRKSAASKHDLFVLIDVVKPYLKFLITYAVLALKVGVLSSPAPNGAGGSVNTQLIIALIKSLVPPLQRYTLMPMPNQQHQSHVKQH
jgi:hypothetical protein